mgnify:CR=1 FL=1
MTPREEALHDCRYALSLSETALNQHILNWTCEAYSNYYEGGISEEDREYLLTIEEIKAKLYTDECLLTKEK